MALNKVHLHERYLGHSVLSTNLFLPSEENNHTFGYQRSLDWYLCNLVNFSIFLLIGKQTVQFWGYNNA